MARPRVTVSEYRSYELPADFPMILLHGEEWRISPVPSTRLHFHNCLEIGVCLNGSGEMVLEEEQLSFSEGTVSFVAPNVLHTTWSSPGTMSLWSYLYLDVEALLKESLLSIPDLPKFNRMLRTGRTLLYPDACPGAYEMVCEIITEMSQKKSGYRACVRGLLLAFITRLLRVYTRQEHPADKQILALTPALEYIHHHYMNTFPMETLAALCHLSPTHFRRLFHEQIGTNPLDLLHQVRVAASCTLLRTSNESVSHIAGQVGYTSLSCYNRHFLRIMGSTPSDWRKSSDGSRRSVVTYTGWMKAETSEEILQKND